MAKPLVRPILLFLYGADAHPERLSACCPDAAVIATAVLDDHRLAFFGHDPLWDGGMETVAAAAGESVHGIVAALTAREADLLDKVRGVRLNGTGSHFHSPATVRSAAGPLDVVLYRLDDGREPAEPSCDYLRYIADGARLAGLPADYADAIAALPAHPAAYPVPRVAYPAMVAAAAGGCAC